VTVAGQRGATAPATPAVVIIGPMGAGKSSVGRRVAKALGVPFTDTDRTIVRDHGPIDSIFAQRGEAAFRALEAAAVGDAVRSGGVVAVGGGAATHPASRDAMSGCRIVLLTVSPEAVAARIAGTDRPLLASGGLDAWTTIADARAATYASLAHVVVDTSRRPMSHVVEEVVGWIRSGAPIPPEDTVALDPSPSPLDSGIEARSVPNPTDRMEEP